MKREHLVTLESDDMGYSIYKVEDDFQVFIKVGFATLELPPGLVPDFKEMVEALHDELERYTNG